MKKYFFYLIIVFAVSCKKNNISTPQSKPDLPGTLNGFVQKGPFAIGSSITLYELDSLLSPTGRVFNTQTTDDKGTFQFDIRNLNSRYVTLEAQGFYFNEDQAFLSNAPLTLYTISDILDSTSSININILTHLSRQRIIYLMQHGTSYADAKIQTRREILNIFGFTKPDIKPFENLDITQAGDDNALLLAISLILQSTNYSAGYGSFDGRFAERLAIISNDIEKDGVFDHNEVNDSIYQWIRNGAFFIDDTVVKANLTTKYAQMGQSIADLNIRKYIDSFLVSTALRYDGTAFYYPKFSGAFTNILALTDSVFTSSFSYPVEEIGLGFTAYVPLNSSLSVKIEVLDSIANPAAFIEHIYNGSVLLDARRTYSKILNLPQQTTQYSVQFATGYSYVIKYYENGATSPSRQKIIKVLN